MSGLTIDEVQEAQGNTDRMSGAAALSTCYCLAQDKIIYLWGDQRHEQRIQAERAEETADRRSSGHEELEDLLDLFRQQKVQDEVGKPVCKL